MIHWFVNAHRNESNKLLTVVIAIKSIHWVYHHTIKKLNLPIYLTMV